MACAVVSLAAALSCTRTNPAFGPGEGSDAEDAEARAEEPAADAAERPDRAPLLVLADAGALDLAPPTDLMPLPFSNAIDDSDLVAYWPLDEGAGNALVQDRSGNGNSGGLAGIDLATAWKPGHAGGALEIPAIKGAAVLVGPSPSLDGTNKALTISAWVYRLESIRNHNMTVASRQVDDSNREVYNLGFQSDVLIVWLYAAAPAAQISLRATGTSPLGQWIHVAVTWDGKTARLYQEGKPVGSVAYGGPLPASDNPVILGNNANSTGIDQPLGGRLDEVRFYARALSASEIAALAGR
jgi:hypothetical protein